MRTSLECVACFYKQIVDTAKVVGASKKDVQIIMNRMARLVPHIDYTKTPVEVSRGVYKIISDVVGVKDLYKDIKRKSNKLALRLYPKLKRCVKDSDDRLFTALKLAFVGNVIDYGAKAHEHHKGEFDLDYEIKKILKYNFRDTIFDYREFKKALKKADSVLYIGDNAGEVVFDRILIEEMKDKNVTYVVRSKPAINDALMEDAVFCGMDKVVPVIESGSDMPGTTLKGAGPEFRRFFNKAPMIISKGQGNLETLLQYKRRPIFFMLKLKCPVIAEYIGCPINSFVLIDNLKKSLKNSFSMSFLRKQESRTC